MKCPHWQIEFHDQIQKLEVDHDLDGFRILESRRCPACDHLVLELVSKTVVKLRGVAPRHGEETTTYLLRQKPSRAQIQYTNMLITSGGVGQSRRET
jgi:hypothetical protein